MRRLILGSAAILLSGVVAAVGQAAPLAAPPVGATASPPIVQVQGWWERDHQEERARQGYWRLPPPAMRRYNELQRDIDQLTRQRAEIEQRINRAEREQREMLGFRR